MARDPFARDPFAGGGDDDLPSLDAFDPSDPSDPWGDLGPGSGEVRESSLHDPDLAQRLRRLAPRAAVEPALAAVLATANSRRWQRRAGTILSAAAVIVALALLARTWSSGDNGQLVAGGTGSTAPAVNTAPGSTRAADSSNGQTGPPETAEGFHGTFIPGTYVPRFPSIPGDATTTSLPNGFPTVPSTTTTAAAPTTTAAPTPRGEVTVEVVPAVSSLAVGGSTTVTVRLKNAMNVPITYQDGGCTQVAVVEATAGGAVVGPSPSVTGAPGFRLADHAADNAAVAAWTLVKGGDNTQIDRACTADLRTHELGAGLQVTVELPLTAPAAPGALPSTIDISATVTYGVGTDSTSSSASGSASIGWTDAGNRTVNVDGVVAALDADPQVQARLESGSFSYWLAYLDGVWELRVYTAPFDASPFRARVDPVSAVVTVG